MRENNPREGIMQKVGNPGEMVIQLKDNLGVSYRSECNPKENNPG